MRDALPNASFVGFTGTPIELQDANTRAVFGDYISIYDVRRSVEDGATVPIYYEGRLAKLILNEDQRPRIDPDFEDATEGEEVERRERLKTKWAQLEAVVGAEPRVQQIAEDIVAHYEQRLEAMHGKAMVVCMSRRICIDLYRELVRLRPEWHDDDDSRGAIKVVMTGSATDPTDWQPHIRNKPRREALAKRFRDPEDPFQIVLVRDMWLTGFDAPCLHTMYVDKPMRGHGLFQAITRVNRVFGDKPGGLVVDYLGLAQDIREATFTYTESGGKGQATVDQGEAVAVMLEKHEVCCAIFHGFDWSAWATGTGQQRLALLPLAQEHVLAQENGKDRFTTAVRELSQAFALASTHEEARRIRDDVAFFQAVRTALTKRPKPSRGPRMNWSWQCDRSSLVPWLQRAWWTSSRQQDWRSRTSQCSPRTSSPKSRACPSATWPWSSCRSSFAVRWPHVGARTWCRRAPSPTCWNSRCGATKTERLRRRKLSRSSSNWRETCARPTPAVSVSACPKMNSPFTTP